MDPTLVGIWSCDDGGRTSTGRRQKEKEMLEFEQVLQAREYFLGAVLAKLHT